MSEKQLVVFLVLKHHAMKTWRSGSRALHILNLSTRWRWMASFMLQLLYSWRKESKVSIGCVAWWGTVPVWMWWRTETYLPLPVIQPVIQPIASHSTDKGKGKAVSVDLIEHHAMKAYWENGGIVPHILGLGTTWGW